MCCISAECTAQGQMMPSTPANAAAFQGATMRLEVTWQGSKPAGMRARLQVHDNDYVGALRHRAAMKMGVQAPCVRLLSNGGARAPHLRFHTQTHLQCLTSRGGVVRHWHTDQARAMRSHLVCLRQAF